MASGTADRLTLLRLFSGAAAKSSHKEVEIIVFLAIMLHKVRRMNQMPYAKLLSMSHVVRIFHASWSLAMTTVILHAFPSVTYVDF